MTDTILLVEDDVDCRSQLDAQLQGLGFSVLTAADVDAATDLFATKKPALAIVDLMLDHLDDGFVLCYRFKRMSAKTPVILMSGVNRETGVNFGAETGEERDWIKADALLHKPFRFEVLQMEIQRLMQGAAHA